MLSQEQAAKRYSTLDVSPRVPVEVSRYNGFHAGANWMCNRIRDYLKELESKQGPTISLTLDEFCEWLYNNCYQYEK